MVDICINQNAKKMETLKTIREVKNIFRDHNSLMVDELKDSYEIRRYLYRLEKTEVLYEFMRNNHFVIYAINQNKENIRINYI